MTHTGQQMARTPDPAIRQHGSGPVIVDLRPGDWQDLREARLAALEDSADAFVTARADEVQLSATDWRSSLGSTWVAARYGDQIIGIARSVVVPEEQGARYVESVWVHPDHRRRGVVRQMLSRLEAHARRHQDTRILLWVLETNIVAKAAYSRLGFTFDGTQQDSKKIGPDGFVKELRMVKPVQEMSRHSP
jgi:ribosomal protein S18 acetylase RimI-like enzyme